MQDMQNMNNTPPRKKKKKKLRLKKNVRIGLYCIGMFTCILLVWGIWNLLSSSKQPDSTLASQTQTATTTPETQGEASDSSEKSTNTKTGLTTYPDEGKKYTVMLDAGHGDLDPGNVMTDIYTNEQYLEKDINLKLVKLIGKKLKETNPNIEVLYTREDDNINFTIDEADLNWRVDEQTDGNGGEPVDFFVSIHCNASGVDSTITGYNFFVKPKDTVMQDMANEIAEKFEEQDWSKNNGTIFTEKNNALQVICFSPTHAMLIETGYMTNDEELTNLLDSKVQEKIANAIAAGISDYIMANPDAASIESPAQTLEEIDPDLKSHSNDTGHQDGDSSETGQNDSSSAADSDSESSSTGQESGYVYDPETGTYVQQGPGLDSAVTDSSTSTGEAQYDMYGNPIQ